MRRMCKFLLIIVILLELLPYVSLSLPGFDNEYMEVRQEKQNYDEYPNLSTNEEEVTDRRRKKIDPHGSWLSFLDREKKGDKKRKNKNKRKRLTCPPGPAGPPGPPGPPGARITQEVMIEEFKELVKKATDKRIAGFIKEKCPPCSYTNNNTGIPNLEQREELLTVPRISVGFYLRLRRNVIVTGRTLMELETFSQPFAAGSFQRGDAFNVRNGRFSAPKDGIYQFSANIHMRVKKKGRRVRLKKRDTVTTQICIDSHCIKYASLRHLTGLESNSKIFTVSFNGFLQLRTNRKYASLRDYKVAEKCEHKWSATDSSRQDNMPQFIFSYHNALLRKRTYLGLYITVLCLVAIALLGWTVYLSLCRQCIKFKCCCSKWIRIHRNIDWNLNT